MTAPLWPPLIAAVAIALAVGLLCGLWLGRRRARRRSWGWSWGWSLRRRWGSRRPAAPWRLGGLDPEQLLRWLETVPAGWLIVDGGDVVRLLNERAERLLAVSGPALLHALPLERVCDAPELAELVAQTRRQVRPQRLDWQRHGQDLELYALPGEAGWVAVQLQSRRSLEAQLAQQERWVSDVAHELKTPLTALLLVGDSLAAQVNSRNAVLVERLLRELRRLQALVGDLLELSRLENTLPRRIGPPGRATPGAWHGEGQGRDGLRLEPLDPEELVQQVWSGLRPLADERGIRLELRTEVDGEPLRLRADGSRLHRALLNLLDNAIRYSPERAAIEVGITRLGAWCRLTVRDRGEGLSEEDSRRLFERFYRGDPARARSRQGGSGLGLAIVQQIAHAHGGRVQASNHPAGGALLELLLPVGG
ncbi:MAG: sensor histidine kinase [Cyanobium sp.]